MTLSTLLTIAADTLSILFMGDVMQHKEQISSALIPGSEISLSESYDYSTYFKHVQKYIDASDFAIANMEFALAGAPFTGYPSFSAPTSLAYEASECGIDLFLCANNHICDKGKRGLKKSFENYTQVGVPITGVYRDSTDEALNNPYIAEIKGCKIAFINFTYGTNGIEVPAPYIVNLLDKERVTTAVTRAKERGADIIIALPHWGNEYVLTPTKNQKDWKTYLYSIGVDAIVGGHPHVIQPLEIKRDSTTSKIEEVTLYSLGNFISNMSKTNTPMGLMLSLQIVLPKTGEPFIDEVTPIPVWCSRDGHFGKGYTALPIEEFIEKEELFNNKPDHQKMVATYNRLKHLFENGE